jgi:hypothetical protein
MDDCKDTEEVRFHKDDDPDREGWYIAIMDCVSPPDENVVDAIGPYDTKEEAEAIMAKYPREEPP